MAKKIKMQYRLFIVGMVFVFLGIILTSFPTSILAGQLSETDKPFPTPFGQCAKSLKSGHIIFNCFGDWSVRKVFKSGRKEHRYSDMKTKMRMSNGVEVTFQINRRASPSCDKTFDQRMNLLLTLLALRTKMSA